MFAVYAPVYFGDAINQLQRAGRDAGGRDAAAGLVDAGARILSSNLPYLRDALFAPVSQDAQRLIAVDAYGHAQGLSLAFHQTRRTGALNRVIDRGVAALDYLVRFLGFNIGPTLIELALAAFVLTTRYSPIVGAARRGGRRALRGVHRRCSPTGATSSGASSTPPTPSCARWRSTASPISRR